VSLPSIGKLDKKQEDNCNIFRDVQVKIFFPDFEQGPFKEMSDTIWTASISRECLFKASVLLSSVLTLMIYGRDAAREGCRLHKPRERKILDGSI
jgi:hypothetical protein